MVRVAGTDPGTSSLDLLILEDGMVLDQCRFLPAQIQSNPELPIQWLQERGPYSAIIGPSGYGIPLKLASQTSEADLALMNLVRADDEGKSKGVAGFRAMLSAFQAANLPIWFIPGVLHLPTVPNWRKFNRIDLGTADKLCVVALTLAEHCTNQTQSTFCLVELGSAFTSCLLVQEGKIVDGICGSAGIPGEKSPGAWDGELAYLLSPLTKQDLFIGGLNYCSNDKDRTCWFLESLHKAIAGLKTIAPFSNVVLSGGMVEHHPELVATLKKELSNWGIVDGLPSLTGAWVKHAAQGAALLADGLAGGKFSSIVESLEIRHGQGSIFDYLLHPRARQLENQFSPGNGRL